MFEGGGGNSRAKPQPATTGAASTGQEIDAGVPARSVRCVWTYGRFGCLIWKVQGRVSPFGTGCVLPSFSVLALPVPQGTRMEVEQNGDCLVFADVSYQGLFVVVVAFG